MDHEAILKTYIYSNVVPLCSLATRISAYYVIKHESTVISMENGTKFT
jgi:hypothetical protein